MRRVAIAGAGFGGLATAVALRRMRARDELEIVLVDRRDDFVMGLRKSWAALGIASLADGRRALRDVRDVTVEQGEVTRIDTAARTIEMDGRSIDADALVIALGARHATDAIPGLADFGINVWDRAETERARGALDTLRDGRLAIGIFGAPYACPPAPFELALLARERLGPAADIVVFSPAPMALPVVGAVESAKVERLLADEGIALMPGRQATTVGERAVEFADGPSIAFDVLFAVPPHRCPQVLVDAGLAEAGGWIRPDPRTLETDQRDVYAIGDCTAIILANGLALPKAGIFAEQQGEVVAARIAARLAGREPDATFGGDGFCYVETGRGMAAKAAGAFLADPVKVAISEPSIAALAEKHEFERSRLARWFGH